MRTEKEVRSFGILRSSHRVDSTLSAFDAPLLRCLLARLLAFFFLVFNSLNPVKIISEKFLFELPVAKVAISTK